MLLYTYITISVCPPSNNVLLSASVFCRSCTRSGATTKCDVAVVIERPNKAPSLLLALGFSIPGLLSSASLFLIADAVERGVKSTFYYKAQLEKTALLLLEGENENALKVSFS